MLCKIGNSIPYRCDELLGELRLRRWQKSGRNVRIQSRKGIKLNLAKGGTGEKEIVRQDGMYYYRSAGIAVARIFVETHDRRYLQPSLGIKTLQSIEKYQVDVLGNYYKVDLPEKRMKFSKEG